jgi:hypothetical protein
MREELVGCFCGVRMKEGGRTSQVPVDGREGVELVFEQVLVLGVEVTKEPERHKGSVVVPSGFVRP